MIDHNILMMEGWLIRRVKNERVPLSLEANGQTSSGGSWRVENDLLYISCDGNDYEFRQSTPTYFVSHNTGNKVVFWKPREVRELTIGGRKVPTQHKVAPEVQEQRKYICSTCVYFTGNSCNKCEGCREAKSEYWSYLIKRGACPLGKWGMVDVETKESHKCRCESPGHCPWHRTITTPESFIACRGGTPPSVCTPAPCIYLGDISKKVDHWVSRRLDGQPQYQCKLYEKCTIVPTKAKLRACLDCRNYLPVTDKDIATKFVDPLVITDRNEQRTTVLRNMLSGGAAFLVCGGPSLKTVSYQRLAERGIFSLGVNNVAGYVPVSAFTCSDPPSKFHSGIFLDPKIMKFLPIPKLRQNRGRLRRKLPDGTFEEMQAWTSGCPNTWGYLRRSWLMEDETWFTEPSAAWGNQNDGVRRFGQKKTACTMLLGLRLLQYLGAKIVFLLGVDFWMDPAAELRENYAFGEHRDAGAITSNNNQYEVTNEWLVNLGPVFERFGFQVFNCNARSHLRAFDYCPFDTALEICRGQVDKEPFDLEGWYAKK